MGESSANAPRGLLGPSHGGTILALGKEKLGVCWGPQASSASRHRELINQPWDNHLASGKASCPSQGPRHSTETNQAGLVHFFSQALLGDFLYFQDQLRG